MRKVFAIAACAASFVLVPALRADQVNVTPSNMNGWTLNSFDDNGNIVTSGPFLGTTQMVTGPGTPPLGTGSAQLETEPIAPAPDPTSPGAGGAAAIATDNYDGTLLSSITSLSYAAYMASNGPVNNQQFPYLALSINTGAAGNVNDSGANANVSDILFFEPPYQQTSTGNPSLPNQNDPGMGNTLPLNTWQTWNAFEGGFWDNDGILGNPGSGVNSLASFLANFPDATIVFGGFPGLGGIALQVGFADSTSLFNGYVDDFTIGTDIAGITTTTTYNFDPNPASAVPLPTTVWGTGILLTSLAVMRLRRRQPAMA